MRLGIVVPQHLEEPSAMFAAALRAREAGLDSLWVSDHLWGRRGSKEDPHRPLLEGWTALAALAAVTDQIRVGILVSRVGLRLPRLLASMAGTLHRISGPRFTLGLGVGDATVVEEQKAYGMPMESLPARFAELDLTIEELSRNCPEVPLMVGGGSRRAMEAAMKAGSWNFWGKPEEFVERVRTLRGMPGGDEVEATWAGSMPDERSIELLEEAGASEAIVPVGDGNFSERIEVLAELSRSSAAVDGPG